jgi:hypothetical protein
LLHVQLQPLSRLPDTASALPLQFAAIVHVSEQFGMAPLKPVAHELQSSLALNCAAHDAHVGPVHWLRHVHTQFGIVPLTLDEWSLQSDGRQMREQLG